MMVQDLGCISDDVLLFGGPYSNLQATEALIKDAQRLNILPSHMICTGDLVAYCADPCETVAQIKDIGCAVVAGNCEQQLAQNALDCGCGFDEGSTCDLLSAGWFSHANSRVTYKDRNWMAALPDIVVFQHFGKKIAVIHGGVSDVSRFIWSVSPADVFREELALLRHHVGPVDMVVAGHSGIPFQRKVDGVMWVNAGVIGMPANNGKSATHYVTLHAGEIGFHDLTYDALAAKSAMEQTGLVQGYHRALIDGYWPSESVLPETLRRTSSA
ncbi:hypothetical protein NBRC116601_06300 [Cognatishimia sp. WU-CL00825]|uniref:metallophosphoesterase family protein n=1 Tax=Cognatishimia sp. WU-CL00825 TaxID=3127658 RepID=UPI003106191F